jgi:hypothetical protein
MDQGLINVNDTKTIIHELNILGGSELPLQSAFKNILPWCQVMHGLVWELLLFLEISLYHPLIDIELGFVFEVSFNIIRTYWLLRFLNIWVDHMSWPLM